MMMLTKGVWGVTIIRLRKSLCGVMKDSGHLVSNFLNNEQGRILSIQPKMYVGAGGGDADIGRSFWSRVCS